MARRKKQRSTVYIVSVGAHLLVGLVLALIPQEKLREVVAIALNEAKEEKKPEPPKPPEHHAERPSHAPGHNTRPVAAAHAAEASAVTGPLFTDIGIALDSNSADGVAVDIAPPPIPVSVAPVVLAKPKVLVAQHTESACTEDIVKARPLSMVRPSYTESARHARVQGRVKIELFVNERGEVTSVKLLDGLGYGLDEAALDAARRLRFSPATLCNKTVAAPFVIAMRFALPT
ncbi:MAG TPA: TonB family protein [Polyangiaceae bacterium]|jgi:protein TonB|nr:TonB family protein [Polyangiaceae bacterium]